MNEELIDYNESVLLHASTNKRAESDCYILTERGHLYISSLGAKSKALQLMYLESISSLNKYNT